MAIGCWLLAIGYWLLAVGCWIKAKITKLKIMRNFRELDIWKNGIEIVKMVYLTTNSLPNNEVYGLSSQIKRAAVSIPSNIAEGCSRSSQKDFKRFLEISLGSAFEVETQLEIIKQLNLIPIKNIDPIISSINNEQKKISKLIGLIKTDLRI